MNYGMYMFFLLILYLLYNTIEEKSSDEATGLCKDGYVVLHGNSRREVLEELPKDYVFLDYKYTFKGCKTNIFHRDISSSQYFIHTRYPVYTYSIYKSKGPLISVCPGSHHTTPYLFSKPVTIYGEKHTGILYNNDLVHAGVFHKEKGKHYEEQYKICHKKDVDKLKMIKKESSHDTGECRDTYFTDFILRKLSLIINYPLNYINLR
uniref:Uncharacterized protein n=1 Tax=viral metagenome TaxID=1070528 RepID=A0A6C0EJB4_9ZZZZ